jgi:predicted N-acetyltransferase YhbS
MITYVDSAEGISEAELKGFFVGWAKAPTSALHLKSLMQSDYVVIARDSEKGSVVGFISAISDHALAAYIPLLEVLPEYQKQGIGTELMTRMLAKLKGMYMVDLICDEELQPYYQRFGMKKALGMMLRDPIRDVDGV